RMPTLAVKHTKTSEKRLLGLARQAFYLPGSAGVSPKRRRPVNPHHSSLITHHSSPGRRLRDAWTRQPIAIPGVFNALVARLADRLGFQAVYLSGGALSAAYGVPDVGLLTLTEFVDEARRIAAATALPLLCDADTGFGEALNVERTVRLFESAGAAGIH